MIPVFRNSITKVGFLNHILPFLSTNLLRLRCSSILTKLQMASMRVVPVLIIKCAGAQFYFVRVSRALSDVWRRAGRMRGLAVKVASKMSSTELLQVTS
jgi:hypothetical protein